MPLDVLCDSVWVMENEKNKERDDMPIVYEISYLLLPSISVEQTSLKTASLKETIEKLGGHIISLEDAVLIDLAYPMVKVVSTSRHKVDSGYFGWMKFEILKGGVEEVKKIIESDDNILRFLIVKTVRENTLINSKMIFKKEDKTKKEEIKGEINAPVPIAKEMESDELDKSIDDLVIA